jgi:hypothetical protein
MVAVDGCTAKEGFFVGWNVFGLKGMCLGLDGSLGQDVSLSSDTKVDG